MSFNNMQTFAFTFFLVTTILSHFACTSEATKLQSPFGVISRDLFGHNVGRGVAPNLLLTTRGGSDEEEEESDEDDEEEEYDDFSEEEEDDDEDLFDDFDLGDDVDDDFKEDNTLDRFIQSYKDTPPLTKGYLTASALATGLGYMTKTDFPKLLVLDWKMVLKRGQIWRPFTTFLNFGKFGISYALTLQFVWQYMSQIERMHHHKPYDFWIMIVFGMLSMVIVYPSLKLNAKFLGHNLSTFLVYVWSRYHEGLDVNVLELFNTRAELLPWFFLLQTFLLEGEMPTLDLLGIVFGHVYHHCKTFGVLRAPDSVVQWYEKSDAAAAIRKKYKKISTDYQV